MRLRAEAAGGAAKSDTALIFVWLPGGPPHLETYDMKPAAPAEIRGLFSPIRTVVPGLDVCELLPLHAKVADRFSIIRSIAHTFADHGGGHKRLLTGREPAEPTGTVNDLPAVGSIVSKVREGRVQRVPHYVACVDGGREGIDTFALGSAYLDLATTPFIVGGDPNSPTFKVRNLTVEPELAQRLDDRVRLLAEFDQLRRGVDNSGKMAAIDAFNQRACIYLTGTETRDAFDLSQEDPLPARSLRPPCVRTAGIAGAAAGRSRRQLCHHHDGKSRPRRAGSARRDLQLGLARGQLPHLQRRCGSGCRATTRRSPPWSRISTIAAWTSSVLLVVTGEFGRTPRLEYQNGTATAATIGRMPCRCWSPAAACEWDKSSARRLLKGEHPNDRPLTPNDLWATVYRHLGIDQDLTFPDFNGRPMPILPYGQPIRELFSG